MDFVEREGHWVANVVSCMNWRLALGLRFYVGKGQISTSHLQKKTSRLNGLCVFSTGIPRTNYAGFPLSLLESYGPGTPMDKIRCTVRAPMGKVQKSVNRCNSICRSRTKRSLAGDCQNNRFVQVWQRLQKQETMKKVRSFYSVFNVTDWLPGFPRGF